jgi:hypothetical protein
VKRLLFGFLLLLSPAAGATEVFSFSQFSGLNTDDSPLLLQNGQTPDSENVVTDDGPGIQGRKGFIIFSTSTSSGLWEFPKSDGTRYLITKTGTSLQATSGSGNFTQTFASVPADRVVVGTVLGDRFYFADTSNGLRYWDGSSVTTASATLTVDKLVTWKGRLAAAGVPGAERVIYLSKYLDGTSWTTPVDPTDDDPAQITVAGSLDETIQALYSSFQDKLIWFKRNSFGGIYGSRRSNFAQRTFSDFIGVSSAETIRDCDGFLRWLGPNRSVWEFDGATYKKISEQVDSLFASVAQGDGASKSQTQTSESHWSGGTASPSGAISTTDISGSLTPKTTTFTDTTSSEFAAGTQSSADWLSTSLTDGSVQLSTSAAADPFLDDAAAEFSAGTLALTRVSGDTVVLSLSTSGVRQNNGPTGSGSTLSCNPSNMRVQFRTERGLFLDAVTLALSKDAAGGGPGDYKLGLLADSSGSPGSQISSTTILASSIATGSSPVDYTISFPTTTLESGTTYWLVLTPLGTCDEAITDGDLFDAFRWYNGADEVNFRYGLIGKEYEATGSIVSRTFDMGFTTNTWLWDWTLFSASVGGSGSGSYETQTSADSVSWDSLVSVTNNTPPTSTVRRYIRYKITLTRGGEIVTPVLSSVAIYSGPRIRPAGTLTSRTFDTGIVSPKLPFWGARVSTITTSGGGAISIFTQSSSDGSSWDARVALSEGAVIGSATKRYLRYQADLSATSPSSVARLEALTLPAKSTGTFETAAFNVGERITAWGPITVSNTLDNGTVTFEFSTSATPTFSAWTSFTSGEVPSVATAPYAAVRVTFNITAGTQTPTVEDITVNWTEGSTIRATSAFFNQRYWLGVAISSTANNRVLVFDKSRQWQRYSGINVDAFALYNSKLYFGNTAGIYEAESGYSDNGSAISAYYLSPTVAPSGLDLFSKFLYLYTTTDSSDSTLATSYQVEGIPTDYSFGSSAMNGTTGLQTIKQPFPVTEVQQGRFISVKWQVPGTSFWRILVANLYFDRDNVPQ